MVELTVLSSAKKTYLKDYSALRKAVRQTLLQGQQQIEAMKVLTYWNTGRLIQRYFEDHPKEEKWGEKICTRLAEDLGFERTLFLRIYKFGRYFEMGATSHQLTWSHYRELLTVSDEPKRKQLMQLAAKEVWPVRRLRVEIAKYKKPKVKMRRRPGTVLEEPHRPQEEIRQIGWLQELAGKKQRVIDLGFANYQKFLTGVATKLKVGDCVAWNVKTKQWVKTGDNSQLYYYQGSVERVVDGDTLLVHVDLGFGIIRRQYLRLRGLDAEPLATASGKKAQRYVQQMILKHRGAIHFKSRFTDRYDRYLSDVWVGNRYLNQCLLDEGLATAV